jgi:hypothetical protein
MFWRTHFSAGPNFIFRLSLLVSESGAENKKERIPLLKEREGIWLEASDLMGVGESKSAFLATTSSRLGRLNGPNWPLSLASRCSCTGR